MPDMDESAWDRAMTATAKTYRSTAFEIGLVIVGLIAASIAIIFTADADSVQVQVAVPLLTGLTALGLVCIGAFLVQLAIAPVKQRNELRREWPTEPVRGPVNVEHNLLHLSRKMLDLSRRPWHNGMPQEAEALHDQATNFLSEHVPDAVAQFTSTGDGDTWEILAARGTLLADLAEQERSRRGAA